MTLTIPVGNHTTPSCDHLPTTNIRPYLGNLVFKTPLPNPQLWNPPTIGTLANPDIFANGGWWHDARILAATGEGLVKEEPRGWEGWWNEKVIELVELSNKQKDALCVLLTGRSESGFSDLIKRMASSRDLSFDMISLKPAVGPDSQRIGSTMKFKQMFLDALMETYKHAEEIRIYEDRPGHVKQFRDYLLDYNKRQNGVGGGKPTRGPITAEVVQVADLATTLDPVVEVAEVQHIINAHNDAVNNQVPGVRPVRLMIKKNVLYTGYLINSTDTQRLLTLAQIPPNMKDHEVKYHANNIMICPRPCSNSVLEKAGGMGSKMTWQVTGLACYENSVWAACVKPVQSTAKFYTDNAVPMVVLAVRKGAQAADSRKIHNWQPVPADKAFMFETTVGEKVVLRIESEDRGDGQDENVFPAKNLKRKHGGDETAGPRHGWSHGGGHGPGNRNEQRNYHQSSHAGRGGQNQGKFRGGHGNQGRGFRGQRGGGQMKGGRGGKGGGHHYKSLDDVAARESQGSFAQQVTYDDTSDRRPQQQQQQPQNPAYPAQPQYQPPYQPQQQQQQQYPFWPQQ